MKKYVIAPVAIAAMVLSLVALVWAFRQPTAASPPPPDEDLVALAAPESAGPDCVCGADCPCDAATSCGCGMVGRKGASYKTAYAEHAHTGKPLVVWVGGARDLRARRRLSASCVTAELPSFLGRSHRCVVVGVWHGGESYVAAELWDEATPETILEAAGKKQRELSAPPARAFPAFQPVFAPPPSFGGFGGDCGPGG